MERKRQFDRERLINLWNEGLETRDIASMIGCSDSYVNYIITKARKEQGEDAILYSDDPRRESIKWAAEVSKHDWSFRLDCLVSSRMRVLA